MGAKLSSAPTARLDTSDPAAQIEHINSQIQQLADARVANERLRGEISAERSSLLRAARVEKDAAAIARIRLIDDEMARIDREVADDTAASESLTDELAEAQREQKRQHWESSRAIVRKAIAERVAAVKVGSLKNAAEAFLTELQKAEESDREISRLLLSFDRKLAADGRNINTVHVARLNVLKFKLYDALGLEEPRYYLERFSTIDLVESELQPLERALDALNGLELVFR